MIGLEALPREQYHRLMRLILSKSCETMKEMTMLEHACGMSERSLSAVLLRPVNWIWYTFSKTDQEDV